MPRCLFFQSILLYDLRSSMLGATPRPKEGSGKYSPSSNHHAHHLSLSGERGDLTKASIFLILLHFVGSMRLQFLPQLKHCRMCSAQIRLQFLLLLRILFNNFSQVSIQSTCFRFRFVQLSQKLCRLSRKLHTPQFQCIQFFQVL